MKIKTPFFQILFLSTLVVMTSVVVSAQTFVAPTANPSGSNVEGPLTVFNTDQYKRGSLAIGKTSNATGSYMLDIIGNLRAQGLSVIGNLFVDGEIISDSLKGQTSASPVCAKDDGTLELCQTQQQSQSVVLVNESRPGIYEFVVPSGVTDIVVEIWGAGGPGYHEINTGSTSGITGCVGSTHIFASTLSTFVGSNVDMKAYPGKCGYKFATYYVGGDGGTATVTGSSAQSVVTTDGADGGTGSAGGSSASSECLADTNYEITIGGAGGTGGAGGASPNGGAGGTGGAGGATGTSSRLSGEIADCNDIINQPSINSENEPGLAGGNGLDGTAPGGGGAGAGGTGGVSEVEADGFECTAIGPCVGTKGYSGGGAGGYAKAVISNLSGGEIFNFVVGGAYKNSDMTIGSQKSGFGAHGRVKVYTQ